MKPLLKWVGSKRRLLPELRARFPLEGDYHYMEPFAGSAALMFDTHKRWKSITISDTNKHLINFYRAVAEDDYLYRNITRLCEGYNANPKKTFEYARQALNGVGRRTMPLPLHVQAAWFWLFNKTCFNGLFRVNQSGHINTPWGKKQHIKPPGLKDFNEAREILRASCIFTVRATSILEGEPEEPHFIYLDPPYLTDKPHGNAYYSGTSYTELDYIALFDKLGKLSNKDKWMLSCAPLPENLRYLVNDYNVDTVQGPRSISCKADGRKPTEEWIVRNYE